MILCAFPNGLDRSNATILTPTLEDLVVATLNSKVLVKAEYSKNWRKLGRGSAPSIAEGPRNRGSRGKAVIDDVVDIPTRSAGHSQDFIGPTLVSRYPTNDAIDRDFFPFAPGLIMLHILRTVLLPIPTREMVRIESLIDEHLVRKMSILHCLMMSHGGELLDRYKRVAEISLGQATDLNDKVTASNATFIKVKDKGKEQKKNIKSLSKTLDQFIADIIRLASNLNQARRSDTQKGDQIAAAKTYLDDIYALIEGYKHSLAEKDTEILQLKASPIEFASFFKGGFQTLVQKFLASDEFIRVQGELLSLAASAGFEHALNMDQTQEQLDAALKKISYFVSRAQGRLVEATPLVATTDYPFLKKIFDHAAHPLSAILNLEPENLARLEVIPSPKTTRVSPSLTRESTVILVSSSCDFPSNGVPSSIVAIVEQLSSEQNEEWVRAMVDTSDIEMMDGAAGWPTKVIVQEETWFPLSYNVLVTGLVDVEGTTVATPSE
ncbi:hypothetical protein Tco_1453944, partial [Tanacetum coccineum]